MSKVKGVRVVARGGARTGRWERLGLGTRAVKPWEEAAVERLKIACLGGRRPKYRVKQGVSGPTFPSLAHAPGQRLVRHTSTDGASVLLQAAFLVGVAVAL